MTPEQIGGLFGVILALPVVWAAIETLAVQARERRERDTALALMVYETWLLNGATPESMPSLELRRWCNRKLKRALFPNKAKKEARDDHEW